jgi:hypothetical protein
MNIWVVAGLLFSLHAQAERICAKTVQEIQTQASLKKKFTELLGQEFPPPPFTITVKGNGKVLDGSSPQCMGALALGAASLPGGATILSGVCSLKPDNKPVYIEAKADGTITHSIGELPANLTKDKKAKILKANVNQLCLNGDSIEISSTYDSAKQQDELPSKLKLDFASVYTSKTVGGRSVLAVTTKLMPANYLAAEVTSERGEIAVTTPSSGTSIAGSPTGGDTAAR